MYDGGHPDEEAQMVDGISGFAMAEFKNGDCVQTEMPNLLLHVTKQVVMKRPATKKVASSSDSDSDDEEHDDIENGTEHICESKQVSQNEKPTTAKAETEGPLPPEPEAEDERHFSKLRLTHAKKGSIRMYVTGVIPAGNRTLITECTLKKSAKYTALMMDLKEQIEAMNYTKAEAIAFRDHLLATDRYV